MKSLKKGDGKKLDFEGEVVEGEGVQVVSEEKKEERKKLPKEKNF